MEASSCLVFIVTVGVTFNNVLAQNTACFADPVTGTCGENDNEHIFFNRTSGRCQYSHGGCTTGSNSFSDWIDCSHACVCPMAPERTSCDVAYFTPKYFFNDTSKLCERFPESDGKCSLNGNAFATESTCKMTCVCSLSAEPGSGDGEESAFFFNSGSKRCEEFTYTGQGGNANRFETQEECKEHCLCGMAMSPGEGEPHCLALFHRVWFNSSAGQCERHSYGGCGANNNHFATMDECEDACP